LTSIFGAQNTGRPHEIFSNASGKASAIRPSLFSARRAVGGVG
jgi:hypothetical protein